MKAYFEYLIYLMSKTLCDMFDMGMRWTLFINSMRKEPVISPSVMI